LNVHRRQFELKLTNDITATLYTLIANSDDRPVHCTMLPQVSDQVGVA